MCCARNYFPSVLMVKMNEMMNSNNLKVKEGFLKLRGTFKRHLRSLQILTSRTRVTCDWYTSTPTD